MRKTLIFFIGLLIVNYSFSQGRIGVRGIDSLENVINKTFRNNSYFIDSGKLYNKDSTEVIGSFKKEFFINKITGNLDLVLYGKRFKSDSSAYESFYFSNNRPMTAYRMIVAPKKLRPEIRFLINGGGAYEWKGHILTPVTDKIRETALALINESKKYK